MLTSASTESCGSFAAVRQLLRTVELNPNFVLAHWYLGQVYERLGRYEQAICELDRAVTLSGGAPVYIAGLAHVAASAGDRERAMRLLRHLRDASSSHRYVAPDNFLIVYAGLGEDDEALRWLERGWRDRSAWMVNVHLDPRLERFYCRPNFRRIVGEIGAAN